MQGALFQATMDPLDRPTDAGSAALGATGIVHGLQMRRSPDVPPTPVRVARALAGVGLAGDCHADPLSPRQVLLVTAAAYDELDLSPGVLRENITLAVASDVLQPGRLLFVGADVVIATTFACEPCARLNAHRPGLLRAVGRHRGVLGRVVRGGELQVGDPVAVGSVTRSDWPDTWQDRVVRVLEAAPAGMVVEYAHLARLAGVPLAYCRVFPRVLAERAPGSAHRAVRSGGGDGQARWQGDSLFNGLRSAIGRHGTG